MEETLRGEREGSEWVVEGEREGGVREMEEGGLCLVD